MLGQVFKRDYPDYSVGAQLNIPIRNRIAKADAARDELQYRQSEVRVQQLHSQVRLQVGNAFIALQQARESYKAAVEARTLQEQALDVEHAKFEAGVATAYEFLQYESSLAEAKSAEVTALGVYAKAKTALQRAVGSTLADNNVTVDDADSNRSAQGRTPAQPGRLLQRLGAAVRRSLRPGHRPARDHSVRSDRSHLRLDARDQHSGKGFR